MAEIQVGAEREERILVTTEVAIDFLGMESARVLSTPHMIGFMERTCRNLVLEFLDPGYDTVGTHVDVRHLAGAPLGASVRFVRPASRRSTNAASPSRWRRSTKKRSSARASTSARLLMWRSSPRAWRPRSSKSRVLLP